MITIELTSSKKNPFKWWFTIYDKSIEIECEDPFNYDDRDVINLSHKQMDEIVKYWLDYKQGKVNE